MAWETLYTPHPVPRGDISNWPRSAGLYDIVDQVFNRIVFFLDSVPVIPNSHGLYDAHGNWLDPMVSVFDVIVVVAIFTSFFVIFSRLAGSPGNIAFGPIVHYSQKMGRGEHKTIKGFLG